jgi:uncharacterized RmlC-like cupin family protein
MSQAGRINLVDYVDQGSDQGHVLDQSVVEDLAGITVIRGGGNQRGWNGILYKQGLSGKNVGAQSLSINVAKVPAGAIAYAHIHDGFEVMLFIVQGKVKHSYGENLEKEVFNEAGDFIYIKPGMPHEVFNVGEEDLIAFVARSTADEWDKIINVPSVYRERDTGSKL